MPTPETGPVSSLSQASELLVTVFDWIETVLAGPGASPSTTIPAQLWVIVLCWIEPPVAFR